MAQERNAAQASGEEGRAVARTVVRGALAKRPEYRRTMEGGEVCRLVVIGEARGPASKPPKVYLYIRNGEGSPAGLRPEEARRCAFGLHLGDVIQAVGDVGPERRRARGQEIIVSEPVRLRARAAGEADTA